MQKRLREREAAREGSETLGEGRETSWEGREIVREGRKIMREEHETVHATDARSCEGRERMRGTR